jgi:TM2 domain-containing membrane protein YozV
VEHGERRAIAGVSQTIVMPRWWRRLLGAVPVFAVRFGIGRDECELRFFAGNAAQEFADAIGETAAAARVDAEGLRVASPVDGVTDPGMRPASVWRQLVLAALIPGLGQLSQGRLWTGILFFTALGVNVIAYLRPMVAHVRRTMDVSPRVLTAAFVTMGLVWLVSLIDAYVYARHDRDR